MDLSQPEISPYRIYNWLNNAFNTKWFLWEPETLLSVFNSSKINCSPENWQKVLCLRLIAASERPWQEYGTFEKVALALNDIIISPGLMEDVTPQQMAFAVYQLRKIKPRNEFSNDIKKYIAAKCFENNLVYLEVPLNIAMDSMRKLLEKRPVLQLLSDETRKNRNKHNIKNDALKFQISELNTIQEYVRQKNDK